ncbi:hypothetical protein [Saccharomonospora glauca]|jgi:hypothetical protein|uniref:Uncharacterized protein n=1 Tax=Saccharomonospora glauca K62 TaxID=928724 RepID=I1D5C4_9PSEU|nr:hypothetical protein [Saccharomonospora glauca]EIF00149.1 hypothetical protein SacglDRAFT_03287 [Saccharomonospora glauca K62]
MDDNDFELNALCGSCEGEGHVSVSKVAVIAGVPQSMVISRPCQWCGDNGRRRLRPPV